VSATNILDWKCALRLYDQSIEKQPDASLLLNIFWPEKDMPDARCGDVVIAFAVKVSRPVLYNMLKNLIIVPGTRLSIFIFAICP
jgi:hypothetical protein